MSRTFTAALPAAIATLTLIVSGAIGPAHAATVSMTATDSGFVTESGATDKFDGLISPATGNYSVGYELACIGGGLCPGTFAPMQRKNYFVFDPLAGLGGAITGATLKLFNPFGGYESTDPTETFVLGATDLPAVVPVLDAISDIGGVTVPTDVPALIPTATDLFMMLADSLGPVGPGSMPVMPSFPFFTIAEATLSSADDGTVVDVVFTPDGVAYLNDMVTFGTDLVLGGALTTADPPSPLPQSVFGFTDVTTLPAPVLVLEVASDIPEPSTAALFLLSLGIAFLAMRRRYVSGPARAHLRARAARSTTRV